MRKWTICQLTNQPTSNFSQGLEGLTFCPGFWLGWLKPLHNLVCGCEWVHGHTHSCRYILYPSFAIVLLLCFYCSMFFLFFFLWLLLCEPPRTSNSIKITNKWGYNVDHERSTCSVFWNTLLLHGGNISLYSHVLRSVKKCLLIWQLFVSLFLGVYYLTEAVKISNIDAYMNTNFNSYFLETYPLSSCKH